MEAGPVPQKLLVTPAAWDHEVNRNPLGPAPFAVELIVFYRQVTGATLCVRGLLSDRYVADSSARKHFVEAQRLLYFL